MPDGGGLPPARQVVAKIPRAFRFLFEPARFKVAHGGRGGGKSHAFAEALIIQAYASRKRILCAREYQSTIADSVHRLLTDKIQSLGLSSWFEVTASSIICPRTGSQFLFKGLRRSMGEIKSTEGIDICWIEEAESTSQDSLDVLIPTIRKEGSEIWISFNPKDPKSPVRKRFLLEDDPRVVARHINWDANPYLTPTLDAERRHLLRTDPTAYAHVWGGAPLVISAAVVFQGRVSVESFETPPDVDRFYFGADFGFAQDPSTLIRSWVRDECLYIDEEAYGVGVELDDLPAFYAGGVGPTSGTHYAGIPGARDWPIKADNSQPAVISKIRREGFNIEGAAKWAGSVEDGVTHLKGFRRIFIHERCKNTAAEFSLYSYKVDAKTGDILPILVDKNNHTIDAIRYGLDGYILSSGSGAQWLRAYGG